MKNENGTELKSKIIGASRKLFYENGFTRTTFRQIADFLDISPGSLSYHFDSKVEIGNTVYTGIMTEYYNKPILQLLLNQYGSYDPRLASGIEMRIQLHAFKEDRKFYRFYNELFNSQPLLSAHAAMTKITIMDDQIFNDASKEMALIASKGATVAVTTAFFEGALSVPFDEFANYKIKSLLQMTGLKSETADRYVRSSYELSERIDYKIVPYFGIEYHGLKTTKK